MQMVIKGKNMEVPEVLRSYVEKKLGKLDRYLDSVGSISVELSKETSKNTGNRHVVQVTVMANGTVLRAEERANDPRSAVDTVTDVLHRQISRYKGRLYKRSRAVNPKVAIAQGVGLHEEVEEDGDERAPRVVKTKQFAYKPVTVEEAIEQMELLGHDFFVFTNCMTNQVNVLYRRRDGDYGLIEPEIG